MVRDWSSDKETDCASAVGAWFTGVGGRSWKPVNPLINAPNRSVATVTGCCHVAELPRTRFRDTACSQLGACVTSHTRTWNVTTCPGSTPGKNTASDSHVPGCDVVAGRNGLNVPGDATSAVSPAFAGPKNSCATQFDPVSGAPARSSTGGRPVSSPLPNWIVDPGTAGAVTSIVTVVTADCSCPSLTRNWNASGPVYPATGVYVSSGAVPLNDPCDGPVVTV